MTARVIKSGAIIHIPEADYCYGSGDIRLRVAHPVTVHPSLEWASVTGTRLAPDGQGTEVVTILVRVKAL